MKKEISKFSTEFKEYLEDSQNIFVQSTLTLKSQIENESQVAKAIREIRKIDPSFNLWEFEHDVKDIFSDVYRAYLNHDMKLLESICSEVALAYFKVLLKKHEELDAEPKYKLLWELESPEFISAGLNDSLQPVFHFTIKTTEIFCLVSKKDKTKVVDGDDTRLFNYEYQFALRPHPNPDYEKIGHCWELIEIQPREIVKLLV